MRDCGDDGSAVQELISAIDAAIDEFLRELRFQFALDALNDHPELQRTLRAIRAHRHCGRRQIAAALRIPVATYAKRFTRICQILAPMLA
jgi:hypothetical protein